MPKSLNKYIFRQFSKSGLKQKEIELAGYKINYWDSEENKPVLILIHGFGASTEFQWYQQVQELSVNYRLILPNLLYFGKSNSNPKVYAIKNQVEALQLLLDTLHVDKFNACGVSYGGLVAAELGLQNSGRLEKLVLVDSPVKYFSDKDETIAKSEFNVSSLEELLIPNQYKGLKKLLAVAYHKPPFVPNFILKEMFYSMYNLQVEDKKELLKSLNSTRDLYANQNYFFHIPVLLVWGEADKLIPLHIGKELQQHIGTTARLEVMPNCAHMPALENPKLFNKILINFLGKKN